MGAALAADVTAQAPNCQAQLLRGRYFGYEGYVRWVTLCAVLSGLVGLALFQSGLLGLCADDFMRMYMAVRWARHPVAFQIGIWPPLQSYLYGSALWLGIPALWVGHLFTAAFAGLSVYMVGKIVFSITSDRKASFLAAILALTAPVQILLSSSMLAEPMYAFWGLLFVYFVWNWISSAQKRSLWFALIACTLMTMSRLDGWPIALLFALFLLYKERNWMGVGRAFLAVAFPLFWLLMMFAKFGNPFILFESYAEEAGQVLQSESAPHFNAFVQFLRFYPLQVVALLLLFWKERSNRVLRWVIIGTSIALLSQFLITLQRGPELFAPRILVLPGLLACVVTGVFLSRYRLWTVLTLLLVHLLAGGFYLRDYRPVYDQKMEKVGQALSDSKAFQEAAAKETVGSDLPTWKLPIVALVSGRPALFRHLFLDPSTRKVILPYPNPPRTFLIESPEILEILKRNISGSSVHSFGEVSLLTSRQRLYRELKKGK